MSNGPEQTRRTFVKTVTYVAPAIVTLKATPALANYASSEVRSKEEIWSQIVGYQYPNGGNE